MPYIGNQHNVGDHVNNFKVLDDISSHTATFDGSATSVISTADNTIRIPEHRFIQGQRVTYTNGGGGNIGGLTTGTAYFVSFDSANTIKLATTLANANSNTVINLSAVGSGTSHTLNVAFDSVNTKFKMTHGSGKAARLNNATQINVAINNVIQRPNLDPNNFTDGFALQDNHKIVFKTAPTVNDIFWGSIIANTIENFDLRDNEVDNFTGDGSTTEFTLSTIPANNESVIVSINGVVQHPSDKNTARSYTLIESIIEFTAAPALGDEIQVRHIGFAGASTNDVSGFYGRTGNVALISSDHITTGDITSRNINSSGIITATTFDGAFSSGVGGSNANFTGIVTAGVFKGGDIEGRNLKITGLSTFVGDASFTGNVSIGGTLTYEDVTNIDSVGIITGKGADINGDLDVDGHTNLDNVSIAGVTTMTGALTISSTTDQMLNLNSSDNNGVSLAFQRNGSRQAYIGYGGGSSGLIIANEVSNGAVAIQGNDGGSIINMLSFASDNKGLATIHGGATIPLDLDVDGHTNLDNVSVAGVSTFSDVVGITSSLNVTGITSISSPYSLQPFTVIGGSHPTPGYTHRNQFVFKTSHGHTDLKFENSYGGNWYGGSVSHTRILWEAYGERNSAVPGGDYGKLGEFCSIQPTNTTGGAFTSLIFKGNDGVAGLSTMCRMYTDRQNFYVHGNTTATIDQVGLGITGNIYHLNDWTSNYSNYDTYFGFPANDQFHLFTADTRKLRVTSNKLTLENLSLGVVINSNVDLNGDIDVDGHTNLDNVSIAGIVTAQQVRYSSGSGNWNGNPRSVVLGYSGTEYAQLGMGWIPTGTNGQHTSNNTDFQSRLQLQDGLQIYGSGASVTSGQTVTWKQCADFKPGGISLYGDGTKRLELLSTGGLKLSNTAGGHLFQYGGSSTNTVAAIDINRYGNGYADIRLSSNYGASLRLAGAADNTDEFNITQDNQKIAYISNEADQAINFSAGGTQVGKFNGSQGVFEVVSGDITAGYHHGNGMYGLLAKRKFRGSDALGGYAIRYASGYESPWIVGYNAGSSYNNQITFGSMTTADRNLATGVQKRMVIDMESGFVGVAEDDPSNRLHLAGTTGTGAGGLLRLDSTTGDNFILFDNTHDSTEWALGYDSSSRDKFDLWYNNGSSYDLQLRLNCTGGKGQLDLGGGMGREFTHLFDMHPFTNPAGALFNYNKNNIYLSQNLFFTGQWQLDEAAAGSYFHQAGGNFNFYSAPSGNANAATSVYKTFGVEANRLPTSLSYGNRPTYKGNLVIFGDSNPTTSGGIEFHTSGGGGAGYGSRITAGADGTISFQVRNNNSAWTTPLQYIWNGDLSWGENPNNTLYDEGSNHGAYYRRQQGSFQFATKSSSGWSNVYLNKNTSGGTNDYRWVDFYWNSSSIGQITYSSGNVVYGGQSDYRLKENVVDITDGISRIKQLRPRKFNWISDPSKNTQDGFIAHEVQSVVPVAVTGTKDQVVTQEEFNNDTQPENKEVGTPIYQQMDYGKVTPLLTAAVKELIAKVETLEAEVAALKGS